MQITYGPRGLTATAEVSASDMPTTMHAKDSRIKINNVMEGRLSNMNGLVACRTIKVWIGPGDLLNILISNFFHRGDFKFSGKPHALMKGVYSLIECGSRSAF